MATESGNESNEDDAVESSGSSKVDPTDKGSATPAQNVSPPTATDRQVEELAESYLARLRRGDSSGFEELVSSHPDLAPHLENRLKFFTALYRATRIPPPREKRSPGQDDLPRPVDSALAGNNSHPYFSNRIHCPHCGNQLQIVQTIDNVVREVTCGSCGSSVRVDTGSESRIERAPAPLPRQLSHFRIVRLLGEGGFGTVYLADDLKLSRQVALKIPRRGYFATLDEEQRFFREARNVARLKHSNIVQVYEISEDRDTPYIVSEFIDGRTLRDVILNGKLTHQEIVKLVIQIAEAVAFAHENKIIHRDLKASNVMVDGNGKAYVVDFGLSRRDDAEFTMTIDGAVLGTIQYMAPEQAAGQQADVGPWSDIYSLGVILYELLCKELPFHGTKRMMIDQVIYEEPRNPRRLNESVPRDLETITLKAMAKKPVARYASADDFAEDLRRWLRREPIRAVPASNLARYWSWCRRHPSTAALMATIATLLVATASISLLWAAEQLRLKNIANRATLHGEKLQYELLMQNGTNGLDRNDLTDAALWFTEALSLRDDSIHRTRVGMIQDRLPKLTHLWATGSVVDEIRFNSDGTRLAVSSFEGRILVYDVHSRKAILDQQVPRYSSLKLSPSGDKLAICGFENHAQLWDIPRQRRIKLLAHTNLVVNSEFDASGNLLATAGFDSFARVWSAADGSKMAEHSFGGLKVNRVNFVPGTDLIAIVTSKEGEVAEDLHLWDHVNDRVIATGMHHEDHISRIEFGIAEQAKQMASASRDGQIRLWDISSGDAIGDGFRLPFSPQRILFCGSTSQVASVSYDFDVQIWDASTGVRQGKEIRVPVSITTVAQDPANRLLALGSNDGLVRLYWRSTGLPATSSLRNGEQASALAFHPDNRRLAIGGSNGVLQIWDLAGSSPTSHVFQHDAPVVQAIFTPDGKRCLTAGLDGKAFVWNTETGQQLGATLEHSSGIIDCSVSQDGKVLATASHDKTVKLWDGYSGIQTGAELNHDSPVSKVVISPDGRRMVSGCFDGSVTSWETNAPPGSSPSIAFKVNLEKRVTCLAYSHDGQTIAAASFDGKVNFWDAVSGQPKFQPLEHPRIAFFCQFMPNGKQLLTGGSNGWAYIWNLTSGEIEHRLQCSGDVNSALIYDGGKRIITTESDGMARFWRITHGHVFNESSVRHATMDSVNDSNINRNQSMIVLAGGSLVPGKDKDQTGAALLWDPANDRILGPPLPHLASVRSAEFDPSGGKILTSSQDHTARLWMIMENRIPLGHAQRIARLYDQRKRDASGRLEIMAPEEQLLEFAALSQLYPEFFSCDATEIERWNADTQLQP